MSLLKKILILGLCLSTLTACGVRGDPVPPSKAGTVVN
jgi:predicted small lipoprotein YifL